MIAHAMSFFLDGFETSSILMQYVYYELGANLDVQSKLREEIERVLLENDGNFTFDALQEMKYLDMVLQGDKIYSIPFYFNSKKIFRIS